MIPAAPWAPFLIVDWEERARRVVAAFRADVSRCLRDPSLQALIDALLPPMDAQSAFFDLARR